MPFQSFAVISSAKIVDNISRFLRNGIVGHRINVF